MKKLRPRVRALKLATEVRQRLTKELGVPVKVIMFGSQARGDATKYSDIDLLVILPVVDRETRKLVSSVAWEVGFEAGKIISTFPTTQQEMEYYAISPFYKAIRKEGVSA
ncbi:MAG: nucleotidyltransferase domain-containing protein [Chloroflexi bacterium]|nr:nucleotidyltransferase domain-containing protein [Chloroflexota bacterium]